MSGEDVSCWCCGQAMNAEGKCPHGCCSAICMECAGAGQKLCCACSEKADNEAELYVV